jgi:hypothetical protein
MSGGAAFGVDAVAEQQRGAFGVGVVVGDEDKRVFEHQLRLSQMLAQAPWPRPASGPAQSVGED